MCVKNTINKGGINMTSFNFKVKPKYKVGDKGFIPVFGVNDKVVLTINKIKLVLDVESQEHVYLYSGVDQVGSVFVDIEEENIDKEGYLDKVIKANVVPLKFDF
ncbi:hypothetical protein D3C81_07130 [compost metagenome]